MLSFFKGMRLDGRRSSRQEKKRNRSNRVRESNPSPLGDLEGDVVCSNTSCATSTSHVESPFPTAVIVISEPGTNEEQPEDISANNIVNVSKTYSIGDAEAARLHALTRETYSMSLQQLRQERQAWRVDRLELDHLRKLLCNDNPFSTGTQLHMLLQEKAEHEEQLDSCQEEIGRLKESLHALLTEQKELKAEVAESRRMLQEKRSPDANKGSRTTGFLADAIRMKELKDQRNKWEVLFFESAEIGARRIEKLEQELESTREELARVTALSLNGSNSDSESNTSTTLSDEEQMQDVTERASRFISNDASRSSEKMLSLEGNFETFGDRRSEYSQEDSFSASAHGSQDNLHQYITDLEKQLVVRPMDLQNLQLDVEESAQCKGANKDPQQSKARGSEHQWMMEIRQKVEGLKVDSDNVDNLLEKRIAELEQELDDALSKLKATECENQQLRMIKDSLVGIHSEMEQLIESLEPLHVELLEQTNRVNEAWAERAAIKQELNRETIKVQENAHQIQILEARIRDLEAEATERTAMLNGVFIELKNEQALRSEDVEIAQQEILSLKQSLESYATDIAILQDALRVANEELRKIKNMPVALLS